ncbi:MAG: DUF3563 family protein [Burkholderiales bacterium]
MNLMQKFFSYLARIDERQKQQYEEAYLAKATNIYELEYRMRELEQKGAVNPWGGFSQR